MMPSLSTDNDKLIKSNAIVSNSDYRRYMTKKAVAIMAHGTKEYSKTLK